MKNIGIKGNPFIKLSGNERQKYKGKYPDYESFYAHSGGNVFGLREASNSYCFVDHLPSGKNSPEKPLEVFAFKVNDMGHAVNITGLTRKASGGYKGNRFSAIALDKAASVAKGNPVFIFPRHRRVSEHLLSFGMQKHGKQKGLLVFRDYNLRRK